MLLQGLLALGVFFLITSQSLRLQQRSASLGPLVLMMQQMMKDVFQFLLLMLGPFFGFASAFVVSFQYDHAGAHDDTMCSLVVNEDDGLWHTLVAKLLASVEALFEILIGADNHLECLHGRSRVATILMIFFLLAIVLLLLNMLIAMMATTYDRIREGLVSHVQVLAALLFVTWSDATAVPSPLVLLGLPYHIGTAVGSVAAAALRPPRGGSGGTASSRSQPPQGKAATAAVWTTGGMPPTKTLSSRELRRALEEWVAQNMGAAEAGEGRDAKAEARAASLEAKIDALAQSVAELLEASGPKVAKPAAAAAKNSPAAAFTA